MPKVKYKKDAQVTIRITASELRVLRREANKRRMSLAEMLREIIEFGLDTEEKLNG